MAACATCGADNREGARFCDRCGSAIGEPRGQRKTVTVVFCDIVGSTALAESLDPEAVRGLLDRYFARMQGIVELHGGIVEKFIGDAVMAVFGAPVAHEDDALRALRAAWAMREALPELDLEARIGVNSGEVVTSGFGTLVTGDAVNVAARLQQAAAAGEILVGETTLALTSNAIEAEPLEPHALKGKTDFVRVSRLLAVRDGSDRVHTQRFVGRRNELALLRAAWRKGLQEKRVAVVTIVGAPGVGKSRLADEFAASLDARVARGRCVAYGEGITYFPVVEVVKQLGAALDDPAAAAALGSLLGESNVSASPDEIAWAFRKLLEVSAPLVVVLDDVQWAEETLLDLVQHVGRFATGAGLILLCLARPEFADRRPDWPVTLHLDVLPAAEVDELLPASAPPALRQRIARAAGGNPLFITEMVAMAAVAGDEIAVPPTLRALLAARLDQLELPERAVLEAAAVEGEVFHAAAIDALCEADAGALLGALVRKDLVRPQRAELEGESGFRFRHMLLRDAAYDATPKATRANLHERYARWIEAHGTGLDAFVGYHLEQAYRFRVELRDERSETAELALRASDRLERAATAALGQSDFAAAAGLLERAAAFPPVPDARRGRLLAELGATLVAKGALGDAERALAEAHALAGATHDEHVEARVLVERQFLEQHRASAGASDHVLDLVERVVPVFERSRDDHGLCRAWTLAAYSEWTLGHVSPASSAWERAAAYALASGADHERAVVLSWLASAAFAGPMAAAEGILRCEQIAVAVRGHPAAEAEVLRPLAGLHAYGGGFDLARDLLARRRAALEDIGSGVHYVVTQTEGVVEMLAGDFAAAERVLRDGCETLERLGENALRSTTAAQLARAVVAQGKYGEADEWRAAAERLAEPNDLLTHILCRGVRAGVLASEGRLGEAEAAAREGVALAATTDLVVAHADALLILASVLECAAASAALAEALGLYELKGNTVSAAAARARLDTFAPA
ncbi:MAG: AAA family ATPase [Actinobacteria bacterium]|nr:AAA family ATPase [Actinomycetota bacterium]